jgi:myotubularin-related protein 3/4
MRYGNCVRHRQTFQSELSNRNRNVKANFFKNSIFISSWFGLLERTMWLQHMSGLLAASVVVCHAIEKNGRPVLVHCSDGWDRTPQIVATAQLCLDPYYRTVEGFRILVEREWLSFGHKFADRVGHGPGSDELNERCPVFLQWLDCVHQIHRQFPCSFEFSMGYLVS